MKITKDNVRAFFLKVIGVAAYCIFTFALGFFWAYSDTETITLENLSEYESLVNTIETKDLIVPENLTIKYERGNIRILKGTMNSANYDEIISAIKGLSISLPKGESILIKFQGTRIKIKEKNIATLFRFGSVIATFEDGIWQKNIDDGWSGQVRFCIILGIISIVLIPIIVFVYLYIICTIIEIINKAQKI